MSCCSYNYYKKLVLLYVSTLTRGIECIYGLSIKEHKIAKITSPFPCPHCLNLLIRVDTP